MTPLTCVVSAYGGAAVRYTGKRGTLINKDSLSSADESSAVLITRPAPKLLIPLFCTLSPLHTHTRAWTRLSVVNCATSMPVLRLPPNPSLRIVGFLTRGQERNGRVVIFHVFYGDTLEHLLGNSGSRIRTSLLFSRNKT